MRYFRKLLNFVSFQDGIRPSANANEVEVLRRRSFHRDNNGTTAIEPTKYFANILAKALTARVAARTRKAFLFLLWKQSSSAERP